MKRTYDFGFDWPNDTILIPNNPNPLIWSCIEELKIVLPTIGVPYVTIKVIINPFLPPNTMIWGGNIYLFDK